MNPDDAAKIALEQAVQLGIAHGHDKIQVTQSASAFYAFLMEETPRVSRLPLAAE